MKAKAKAKAKDNGKLRIGDDWNAIRIIALSQSNPLKAIVDKYPLICRLQFVVTLLAFVREA
jgi:hypothetical protein